MSRKKILLLFMAAALIGVTVTGCDKNTPGNTKENDTENEKSQSSGIQMPKGESLDQALMEEFKAANDITALCQKYETIQIDSEYVFMDENGKKSDGGTLQELYCMRENDLVYQSNMDGYVFYQKGNKINYTKDLLIDGDTETPFYTVGYYTDAFIEMYGETMLNNIYTGSEYADQSGYRETSDGYEIYEMYDFGDGTGNVITYYTNKDKEIQKIESVTYPKNAARYVDSTRVVQTGVEVSGNAIDEFENGEVTVTVIEKTSGTQTELRMPAGTELSFRAGDNEIITLDEQGTQLLGETVYDTYATMTESTTLYVVESGEME